MRVFLAYARDDSSELAALENCLQEAGHTVEKDRPEATSNPFWRQALLPSIQRADATLVVWSHHAAASPWLDQEIRAVRGRRLWFTIDEAPMPIQAASDDRVTSPREIAATLGRVRAHTRQSFTPSAQSCVEVEWRRHEHVERGLGVVRRVMAGPPGTTTLVERDDATLVDDSHGMEFRYVNTDVYLGALSVTAAQSDRFAAATQLPMPSACTALPAEAPVVGVTWFEALACAYWFGGTLPSEAHWEDAASVHGRFKYATASGRLSQALAHYDKPFASGTPVPQRDYSPTPSGFFGMCGNTWDWCSDSWDTHRAIRGGCWMDSERFCDTRARYRNAPVDRDTAVGFRVQIHVHKRKDGRYETRRNGFPELDC